MKSLTTSRNLHAIDGDGNVAAPNDATGFVALDADTHYFAIPHADIAERTSIHILTDAALEGVFTVEACDFPAVRGGAVLAGPADVTDHDEAAGTWVQVETASAGWAQTSGVGWAAAELELTKTAGAGGALINLVNHGSRRLRLRAVITTPGTCRVAAHGKC